MNWNRVFLVLSGSPENHPKMIAAAGIFVVIWFAMDAIEFVDWANSKLSPQNSVCIPVSSVKTNPISTMGTITLSPATK